jgi:hypothetical protein
MFYSIGKYNIVSTKIYVLSFGIDCEHPTIEVLWVIHKFSVIVLESAHLISIGPIE